MSLVALALRVVTVKALQGRTLAGMRVFDSDIGTIDERVEGERLPYLTIYTDDDKLELNDVDLFGGDRTLRLAVEEVICQTVAVPADQGSVALSFVTTDATIELQLDFIRRQISRVLSDPLNPWSELWRSIVTKVRTIEVQRGASADKGVRFAAKQVAFHVDTISDPVPGQVLDDVWLTLVEALEADAELSDIGKLIRMEFGDDAGDAAALFQRMKGITAGTMTAVGLGAVAGRSAKPFQRATIRSDLGNRDVVL